MLAGDAMVAAWASERKPAEKPVEKSGRHAAEAKKKPARQHDARAW
jgi:hypothetical protein